MADQQAEKHRHLTEDPIPGLICRMAVPTILSMLVTSVYNMADTYFVGALGESQQAATGILFTLQAIIQAEKHSSAYYSVDID